MSASKTQRKRDADLAAALDKRSSEREKASRKQAKKTVNKPLTSAQQKAVEAKVALDAEQKAVAKACLDEILEVCKKHNCHLHARPITVPRNDGYYMLAAEPLVSNLPPNLTPEEAPSE